MELMHSSKSRFSRPDAWNKIAIKPQEVTADTAPLPQLPQKGLPDTKMSKLSELASSIAAATKAVEDEADRALSRLHKARDNATVGIAKIDGVSASIEASTKDIENFTNQISNGGPPL
jgi:hypothetical protein